MMQASKKLEEKTGLPSKEALHAVTRHASKKELQLIRECSEFLSAATEQKMVHLHDPRRPKVRTSQVVAWLGAPPHL